MYGLEYLRRPQVFGGDDWGVVYGSYGQYDPSSMGGGGMDIGAIDNTYQPAPITPNQMGVPPPPSTQVAGPARTPIPTLEEQIARINQLYTPETRASDRMNNLLDRYPEQYNPTKMDRWTAMLVGLGERNKQNGDPIGVQNSILQGPRIRDIEDWKNQATPFINAANNENNRNIQERTLFSNMITADTQARRLEETARNNDMRNEVQQETNRIRNLVANGFVNITGPHDTTYKLQNKATGQIIYTNAKTGSLPELDAIRERGAQEIAAARERGIAQANANSTRQGTPFTRKNPETGQEEQIVIYSDGTYKVVTERQEGVPGSGVGQTVPITAPGTTPGKATTPTTGKKLTGQVDKTGTEKPLTPSQQRIQNSLEIEKIIGANPEYNDFVSYNEDTHLYERMLRKPEPPAPARLGGLIGPGEEEWRKYKQDMEVYNKIKKLLYPDSPPEPVVGGSIAENKAEAIRKQKEQKSTTTTTVNVSGMPVAPSQRRAVEASTSTVGPTNSPSRPSSTSSLPSTTSTVPQKLKGADRPRDMSTIPPTTSSTRNTWMPDSGGKYAFLPDWMNKKEATSSTTTTTRPTDRVMTDIDAARKAIRDARRNEAPTTSTVFPEQRVERGRNTTWDQSYGYEPKPLPATAPPPPRGAELVEKNGKYRYTTDNWNTAYELRGGRWVRIQ